MRLHYLFLVALISVVCCVEIDTANRVCACEREAILLSDIKELNLVKGAFTASRRLPSIPQIQCTGGSAQGHKEPHTIRCVNVGHSQPRWRCEADLDTDVKLGEVTVTCEGYAGPHDPYVLHGSCGLKYHLEYTTWSSHIIGHIGRILNKFIIIPLTWVLYGAIIGLIGLVSLAVFKPLPWKKSNQQARTVENDEEADEDYQDEEDDEEGDEEIEELIKEEITWKERLRPRGVASPGVYFTSFLFLCN